MDKREGWPETLGRIIFVPIWMGGVGAGLGAIWSAALPGSGSSGAMWGGIAAAAVTFLFVGILGLGTGTHRGQRTITQGYIMLFAPVAGVIGIVGGVVWAIRAAAGN